ncbi:MAG TPA: hypothetical protein VFM39_02250, partial [bacterium]|nr:hypothetical protein [bacterium]
MPVLNCICGHRIEGADDAALFELMRVHSDQTHADLRITDAQIHEVLALWSRMTPWDGRPQPLPGPLEIRPLDLERLDDFLRFFDREAFMDNPIWGSCYCMAPCVPPEQFRQQSGEQRRAGQRALIVGGQTQGLLAYAGGRVVGWCHAAPRPT